MAEDSIDHLLSQWKQERPDLETSGLGLVIRIEILAKLLQRSTAKSLAGLGLKTWEYDVLSALRRQGEPYALPATELARASRLSSGAMTTRIDQLQRRGLVERQPDPEDRRGVRVTLTPDGSALIDRAIEARLAAARSSVEGLAPTDRAAVEGGLRKLLLSLDARAG